MKFPHFKNSRTYSKLSSLITVLAALLCLQQHCQAQQQSDSQSAVAANPLQYVNWTSGPQKVPLGDVASINIPARYRLTDIHGARMILTTFHDAIPDDLVGILVPTSGHWMAILEYSPVGYVKNPAMTQINTKAALKQILNQIGKQEQSSVTSLSWQSPPVYDNPSHVLKWSIQIVTPSSKILNQTAAMFGRHGVVQLTVVEHASDTSAHSSEQLASGITFKAGERYADFKKGDKIADIGLAELISGERHSQVAGASSGGFGSVVPWIYCGLAACVITGGVAVVRRRNKLQRGQTQGIPAPKNNGPVKTTSSNPASVPVKISKSNVHAQPKPVLNHSHLVQPFRRRRRKRIFDYTKFYGKIMRELSGHTYGPPTTSHVKFHSNSDDYGHVNGHGNHDSHGHANVHSDSHAASHNMNINQTQTAKPEVEDLIAMQQSLIQQQQCLLDEQTRLIEEKRRLIEEQTAFLKSRSDLAADQQQHPLKIAS